MVFLLASKLIPKSSWVRWNQTIAASQRWASTSSYRPIHKVLIANRGEIACRILRTAKKMGIRSVAVFSDPDRNSMHVAQADEAFHIGPAASTGSCVLDPEENGISESYLRGDKILSIAKETSTDAIHPGYGFLSENAEFADLCHQSGVIFMGPPSSAIRDMGIKNTAKRIMEDAGVPVVKGYHGDAQDDSLLKEEARKIGYPVMLKAVRGGGGKGMRIAMDESEFDSQLESARREARKSFGNDDMILEKFVVNPRHVEVQVFGDTHGNYVYLYERDCSVQRRHQKIVEEAPAPGISEETRKALGEAAVRAAAAVDYVGAGTVEFIMDSQEQFYFMEMNTRLQVEHPVSEMITNTDLVEWQFRVAQGERLPVKSQAEVIRSGHSAEARIYAEDPENNFMPGAGSLLHLRATDPVPDFLRIETGVREGDEVSVHYDPMISKLVVWGPDRVSAFRRLDRVLADYHLVGLRTNVEFLRTLIKHPAFLEGKVYTEFIPDHYSELFPAKQPPSAQILAQAAAAVILRQLAAVQGRASYNPNDPFSATDSYRVNLEQSDNVEFQFGDQKLKMKVVKPIRAEGYAVELEDGSRVDFGLKQTEHDGQSLKFEVDFGSSVVKSKAVWVDDTLNLFTDEGRFEFSIPAPKWLKETAGAAGGVGGSVAPMPGVVEKVMVQAGEEVTAGQPVVVMVAMKMEYVIKAGRDGKIAQVLCNEGESVAKNAVLVKLEEQAEQ